MDSSDMPGPALPGVPELDKLINQYVLLRDRKRAIEAQHTAQLAPYRKVMSELEGLMLDYMQRAGVDSVSTSGGTAYQSTKRSATIKDGAAFRKFVVETGAYNLVDWRANANAVFDYLGAHEGTPPPGVNPSSRVTVNFRRPNEQE
jgi:hypothetical protein